MRRGTSFVHMGYIWLGYTDRLKDGEFVDVYGRKSKDLDPGWQGDASDLQFMKKHKFFKGPFRRPDENCLSMFLSLQRFPDEWEKTGFLNLVELNCATSQSLFALGPPGVERPVIKEMSVICESTSKLTFKIS